MDESNKCKHKRGNEGWVACFFDTIPKIEILYFYFAYFNQNFVFLNIFFGYSKEYDQQGHYWPKNNDQRNISFEFH